MSCRLRQNTTSGTSANGIPNERITWLTIRVRLGLTPAASTTSAGVMVTARRTHNGTRRRR